MARHRQHTVSRHARLAQPGLWRQILPVIGAALVSVLVAAVALVGFQVVSYTSALQAHAVELSSKPEAPPAIGEYPGAFNLLLIGTDECDPSIASVIGQDRCLGADANGYNNDVTIMVHVSAAPRRITVVSFPRDLILTQPTCTDKDGTTSGPADVMLNATYNAGGLKCVADTITQLTGEKIDFAAKVSFVDVMKITDAVGGVTVCLASPINDPDTGISWPAGEQTVSGASALQFLRTRHGIGDGSDLARIGNQQQYLSRLVNKIRSSDVLHDPGALLKLADIVSQNMQTDTELANPIRLVQLAMTVADVPPAQITFVKYPTYDDPSDPNRQLASTDQAQTLLDAINQNDATQLTGDVGSNDGVQLATPSAAAQATPTPTTSDTPAPSAAPSSAPVQLPSTITGSTAAQQTCSVGNG